jgi:hypothetical protein
MDILNKAKLFGNYSLAFGKTAKVLEKASLYLPKNFNALTKTLEKKIDTKQELSEVLGQDYVISCFHKPLSQKLPKAEFDTWKVSMKTAVITKAVCNWMKMENYEQSFIAALVRDLPIMILRLEDPENYKMFEEKAMEGMSISQASLLAFGIGLEQYIEQFMKHFNYQFVDQEYEKIIDFSFYLAESFSNKNEKASTLWLNSQDEMKKLGLEMDEDKWANHISLLFVKTLELEQKFHL